LTVFAASSLLFFIHAVGPLLAVFILLVLAIAGSVALVPSAYLTRRSLWLAQRATPALSWMLERLQPVFSVIGRFVRKHRPVRVHTGLYEKSDLIELLEKQKVQDDNRIIPGEIELLQHALSFGDKLVANALVPKRVVKSVASSEPVGPILMADLHASGHSRFPVYDGKKDNVVGVLYLHDLVTAKQVGTVVDVMKTKMTYVHEDFTLYQTLQAFLKTKHHLFLVVNSFEEFVGIITIEDVLEQMIGKAIVDEFDQYDDLRAVAAAAARKEHSEHQKTKEEPKPEEGTTADATEVV
jgi:CBS domain containing-hemolysin-like protein